MSIVQIERTLIAGAGDNLLVLDLAGHTSNLIQIPEPAKIPPNLSKGQEAVLRGYRRVSCMTICFPGDLVAVATENKQITVYNLRTFTVVKQIVTNRSASALVFTPDNNILIADKTGDVYLYQLHGDSCQGELILGHLSMLLDIKLSSCKKYIITCDRDEKIRVSHYPNAYNIVSYCLGHREFVTNLELWDDILISASGDGTVRFWDYVNGTELYRINTNAFIEDTNILKKFCDEMDEDKVDIVALPVTNMKVFKHDNYILIAVSLLDIGIQVYKVTKDINKIESLLLQTIHENFDIFCFSSEQNFYILNSTGFVVYVFENGKFIEIHSKFLNEVNEKYKDMFECLRKSDISVLYKRKFDNVQEYLERKKMRIEGKQLA